MAFLLALALQDVVFADFEGDGWGAWKAEGAAFGSGPAKGTLPRQQAVTGFLGAGLVNSYRDGDDSEGSLVSPEFAVERKRINFLVGGGRHEGKACVNLVVDGKVVRSATGRDAEHLLWRSWDVAEFRGRTARIEIVDRQKGNWGHVNVDHVVFSDEAPKVADERELLLEAAEKSVAAAAERAAKDPDRPVYHLAPPANWVNDPNGPVYWNGAYHLFYQHNPYGDFWEHMHWGHWRSRDLVKWEQQPIALWPSRALGENHVFSGCAAVDGKGGLMLFYTSIGNRAPEQWAALPEDADLVKWKKHPANPILTEKLHGDTKIHEWRDPFVFTHDGKTWMVCGGNTNGTKGGEAVVALYRAEDAELTKWSYRGILFTHTDPAVVDIECPLFFKLGARWVLIHSPYGKVQWHTGDLDGATMRFTARTSGFLDTGSFYAPNVMEGPDGRRLMWGWVRDFPKGRGWNGCMTLARVLTLGADGTLRQDPAAEVGKLRGAAATKGDALEVAAVFDGPGSISFRPGVAVTWDGKQLDVAGAKLAASGKPRVRIFLDRTVLEVYVDGRALTRVVQGGEAAVGTSGAVSGVESWQMGSLWLIK